MESCVLYLQGLYLQLLVDVEAEYPDLRKHCNRDSSRLLAYIKSRGLPFMMVDLPSYGKHFDKALAAGLLTPSGLPGMGVAKRGEAVPRLFKGLLLKVFDKNGELRSQPDILAIKFLRQLYYLAKKYKIESSKPATWKLVDDFFSTDSQVRLGTLLWNSDEFSTEGLGSLHFGDDHRLLSTFDTDLQLSSANDQDIGGSPIYFARSSIGHYLQTVADIVSAEFGRFDSSEWGSKHGPGAVSDLRSGSFKYDFPYWSDKLSRSFPMDLIGFANWTHWINVIQSKVGQNLYKNDEPASKLIVVPKTLKAPRLIAAEPTSHQWCQQSLLKYFLAGIEQSSISKSIHIRDQTYNQRLAQQASHTQSHVTIDLSSASDRVSCWVVERLFRRVPSLVEALYSSRTRRVSNAIDRKSPPLYELRKFSCMGSACTFPVQSILFTVIAVTSVLFTRKMKPSIAAIRRVASEVQVYGDDIIVPADSAVLTQGLLGDLGLKVNPDKTFCTGRFRESCGVDAYDGENVSPAYAKSYPEVARPESIVSSVEGHNNFFMKGLMNVAHYVRRTVLQKRKFRFPEVPVGSGTFGWFSYDPNNDFLGKPRFNRRYQTLEYRVDRVKTRTTWCHPDVDSVLLQYFTVAQSAPKYLEGDRLGVGQRPSIVIGRGWEGPAL